MNFLFKIEQHRRFFSLEGEISKSILGQNSSHLTSAVRREKFARSQKRKVAENLVLLSKSGIINSDARNLCALAIKILLLRGENVCSAAAAALAKNLI